MKKTRLDRDSLILKAAIEFGPDNIYTIRDGGLGTTLVVDAETRTRARKVRQLVPTDWEGIYTIVVYSTDDNVDEEEFLDDKLYDPK